MMCLQLKGHMDPSNVICMSSPICRYVHATSDICCHGAFSNGFIYSYKNIQLNCCINDYLAVWYGFNLMTNTS